jgi:hypothetical protein
MPGWKRLGEVEGRIMAALSTPAGAFHRHAESASGFRLIKPRARVLSVSANQADHLTLHRFIDTAQFRLLTADTCRDAVRQLWLNGARVVFCDSVLPDGTWKNVIGHISSLGNPPRFAVVSTLVGASLWSEVLDLGGTDVLARPLAARDVRRVMTSVWRNDMYPASRARGVRFLR